MEKPCWWSQWYGVDQMWINITWYSNLLTDKNIQWVTPFIHGSDGTHTIVLQKKDTLLKKVQMINGVPCSPRMGLNRNPSHKWVAFNNPIKWTEVRAPYPISPRTRSFSAWFIIYWFSGLFRWQSGACFYCVCHSPHSLRVSILSWRFIYFTMTCLPFTFWFSFPCLFMFSLTWLPFTEFRSLGNKCLF